MGSCGVFKGIGRCFSLGLGHCFLKLDIGHTFVLGIS